jgi:hypothetical protein
MFPHLPEAREKVVHVRSYRRFRHGKWERVCSHFRRWPR